MTRLLKKRNNPVRHCFTLVELMVAIGILLSVAGLIGTASMTFFKAWDSAQKHVRELKEYHAIDLIMDSCIRNAIPFHWNDDANETDSDLVFDGQIDQLHFVSLRRCYSGDEGAMLFVRIRLDDSNRLIAEYSGYPRFPWTQLEDADHPMETEVLAENVRSISFLYGGQNSGTVEWSDDWDREEYDFLPLAIQMTVEWEDGRSEQWLRRVAGASSNSYWGTTQGDLGL